MGGSMLKMLLRVYGAVHALFALIFAVIAGVLLYVSAREVWTAVSGGLDGKAAQHLIEVIGTVAIAVVALQVSQTITEEEVAREAHVSSPTRVRRFLSRFFVVLIIALAVEGLVATMKALHEDMSRLPEAAAVLAATGVLLAAWGVFLRLNVPSERLEPEAMEDAKSEDRKFE
jgi:uncharacterized membrane protein